MIKKIKLFDNHNLSFKGQNGRGEGWEGETLGRLAFW
jgi:hypothetical protein